MAYERLNLKTGQVITEEVFAHLEDGIEGAANAVLMTPILYADLVALRDAGQLKAGMFYRITDYVTTTVQENTQSAGHAFDVIVMATDSKTLSEEARAIVHDGDTYFTEAGANLAAWKVWYALDNDSARFAWAEAENGKGVIYRLIDERNNDCPYDFKNVQFIFVRTFDCSQYGSSHTYSQTGNVISIGGTDFHEYKRTRTTSGPPPPPELLYAAVEIPDVTMELYEISNGEATQYTSATITSVEQNSGTFYTFCHIIGGSVGLQDDSLKKSCYNNRMLPDIVFEGIPGIRRLNFNTLENSCCNNSFDSNCTYNRLSYACEGNTFGAGCQYNSLGNNCSYNSFGNNCSYNSFKNSEGEVVAYANNNSFGSGCSSVILQNDVTASYGQQIQNYRVTLGLTGKVEVTRGSGYETTIAKATDGTIKQFNLADLAN